MTMSIIHDAIQDHASRRVQLFYYLALAYFKEGCKIIKVKTTDQHGFSTRKNFNAAHSSILPNVIDNSFSEIKKSLLKQPLSSIMEEKLRALGVSNAKIAASKGRILSEKEICNLLKDIDFTQGLLNQECHFYHNMNSTVELPEIVNQYDGVIEGKLRDKCIKLLNNVSQGASPLPPYEALKIFVKELKVFFKQSEEQTKEKIECLKEIGDLENALWDLQNKSKRNSLQTFHDLVTKLSNAYLSLDTLQGYSLPIKSEKRMPWHRDLFDLVTLPFDKLVPIYKQKIKENPNWTPVPVDRDIAKLEETLTIIEHQRYGASCLPDEEFLSGKVVNNVRVPLTNEELLQEKLDIIRRIFPKSTRD